ncbi:hypothetical protein [Streptomyces shenzhenensis]|uniref:hypothetical protein n=1 Tax=Streptomyces shenzhenensis TaxID=943815 RepID=UPI0015F05AF7|nr:hypothetical protein [Streptomyces shenzhenensis]
MTTNTTAKKTPVAAEQSSSPTNDTTDGHSDRVLSAAAVVGPPLGEAEKPVTVILSHHLRIDGTDYRPGAEITVSPDYARRLRGQGFTARI